MVMGTWTQYSRVEDGPETIRHYPEVPKPPAEPSPLFCGRVVRSHTTGQHSARDAEGFPARRRREKALWQGGAGRDGAGPEVYGGGASEPYRGRARAARSGAVRCGAVR